MKSDALITLASKSTEKGDRAMLNAGRSNPKLGSGNPRGAFFTLGQFAITECKRVVDLTDLGGMPARGRDCRAAERMARDADYLMPPSVLVCLDDPTLGAGGLRKRIGLTGGVSVSKMEIRAPWVS